MKYLPNLHTSTVILFSILAILGFYYSKKEEQRQKLKYEVNVILAMSCIEPTIETKPLITQVKKQKVRVDKNSM